MTETTTIAPVRKTVTVKATAERAFRVFTDQIDSWWPRTHHIGKSPMTKTLIEGRVGGRCYSEQADNTECDWGEILVWEPPSRFVMAWKIAANWQPEPDLAKSSEVEVRFIPEGAGVTRVELEHRHFERMAVGGEEMRFMVDGQMGWGELMNMFAGIAETE